MRARYYDPATGRFISKDPVEGKAIDTQTQNGYNYANANPINGSDHTGNIAVLIALGESDAVGATAGIVKESITNPYEF